MITKYKSYVVLIAILVGLFTAGILQVQAVASVGSIDSSQYQENPVYVVQSAPGSFFGTLQWKPIDGASSYQIYKTGSIRPGWRKFTSVPFGLNKITVSDKPGSLAVYRVAAIVAGKEVQIGTFKYFPSR